MNALKLSAAIVALVAGMSTAQAAKIDVSDGTVTTNDKTITVDAGTDAERTEFHPGQSGRATDITATISDIDESDLSGTLATKINNKADQSALNAQAKRITSNDSDISRIKSDIGHTNRRISNNTSRIYANARDIVGNKRNIQTNRAFIGSNARGIQSNRAFIGSNARNIHINRAFISSNSHRIDTNKQNIATNTANISTNAANISSNTSSIVSLEQDVDELRSGVAMAVAIANAPVLQGGKNGISVSGGFGHFKGKAASALKVAFLPTENMAVTASVATDFSNNVTAGAGLGFSF
ncbi:hypothetical protein PsW64_03993 [Pseudovibrio sp. W64]|uniref:YadA C-terminal domain-containing protein n=1 Tax=unclassified Pseudovibrio TaxID=2627060 RepID=UPI0007AEC605|nr:MULTISPECIES: YadA C-terminal domain-containing protein [unclassified Pseudovibrio]KZK78354.1 hypothetical protein PsW64_03993 [Pseudovibrio sp. W64]KZK84745.1 hypothetical protein PsAD13_02210 [Pseudovibrio sp. Ad13]KZK90492.1 hypothetical protein PsAD46_02113 [Pseudovibrio sp. Ad46]KZK92786.1 hypothetical protein PsAD5_03507 [Pseudovibrio sp. Ad5]KZK98799.1 hypothetical protein PsW74_03388 [Pseudovibrio sp. W74]